MIEPIPTDVVVAEHGSNPHTIYSVGTPATPDQFVADTREEAILMAKRYARNTRVRAWFQAPNGTLTLIYSILSFD